MKSGFKALMLTTAISAFIAPAALAQEGENPFLRGRYTAVTERGQPEFDPTPMRAGAFVIESSVGASAEYNDNIFAAPTNEQSDTIIRIQPNVVARSDWSAHELAAGLNVDHREYLENDSESATDYNAFVNGRIDVTRNFMVRLGVDGAHQTEPRYQAASFGTSEAASFDSYNVFSEAIYRQDRLQAQVTIGAGEQTFDQTVQQIRDNKTTFFGGRLSYAISPDIAVFVQGRQSDLNYTASDRDGKRTTYDAGVNFELGAPFRGEIAVGSFKDDRDSVAYQDISGLNVSANVQWFPTELTTVTFTANRGVFDPGLLNSVSAVGTTYGVRVDHELLRNLLLFGSLRQEKAKYEGASIDREDDALAAAVGAAWKLNRNARLEAQYSVRSQDSSGINAGPEMDQNVISVGIRVYP